MYTVGWIGLGKLGLTCSLALRNVAGCHVVGYDTQPETVMRHWSTLDSFEDDVIRLTDPPELVESPDDVVRLIDDLVFVSVPTAHRDGLGGDVPMDEPPEDFDYSELRDVVTQLNEAARLQDRSITVVIVSTVLPQTMRTDVSHRVDRNHVTLIYNPFFIAMGTTIRDFLNPEFVLIGVESDGNDALPLIHLYEQMYRTVERSFSYNVMTWDEAELTKVAYNTFISMKIVFANTLGEIAQKIPYVDVDTVTNALSQGSRRITSNAYLHAGMGDGGACHPRDNIAMSYLADRLTLSVDPFAFVTSARERQTWSLARYVVDEAERTNLPIVVMGKAYKADSPLTAGSPALLLYHYLEDSRHHVTQWDPYVDSDGLPAPDYRAVYVIATDHELFQYFDFPCGSTVITPFRSPLKGDKCTYVVELGASNG